LRAVATTATCMPRRARTRSEKARSGPGVLAAAQAASTSMPRACARPCLVIRPVLGGLAAGLAHPGVEAEIADQPLRGREATEVADRGHDRQRHGGVHPGDGHEPADLGTLQPDPAEFGVHDAKLLAVEVELAQQRPDRLVLVWWELLGGQPHPALVPEQIRGRAATDEVAVQDRLDLVPAAGCAAPRCGRGG
jgi:hypothetical protein